MANQEAPPKPNTPENQPGEGRFIRLRNDFETPPEMSMIEVRDVIRGMMRIAFSQPNDQSDSPANAG